MTTPVLVQRRLHTSGSPAPCEDMDTRSTAPARRSRPRKAANDRWSASSSVEWLGSDNRTVGRTPDAQSVPPGAIKAKVHYRVEGKPKKPTFRGATMAADVMRFQTLLAAAHAHNWLADEKGIPLAPLSFPEQPSLAAMSPLPSPAPGSPLRLPEREGAGQDVSKVAAWSKRRHETRLMKSGEPRRKNTNRDYAADLKFFLELALYGPSDARLTDEVQEGQPWRLDDPASRVTEADLLWMIEQRACTNLRTRRSNQVRMERWGEQVARATRNGQAAEALPSAPDLVAEVASARTIEAFARTVREMFHDAFAHGLIDYQPWTARVDDEVPRASTPAYSTKLVPSRDEVQLISEAMRDVTLTARTTAGTREQCSGNRYSALVWLAGREALRPEESIALRDSWVFLDDDPRIELHGAEIFEVQKVGPRKRVAVPLKHRLAGEVRVVRPAPEDRDEFVRVLKEHKAQFVPSGAAKQTGKAADPYFFTNHAGDPVELSNFGRWWRAALDAVPTEQRTAALDGLSFRRLRAAAITDWLVTRRFSTDQAATKAGNTQQVIERHYKSVIASVPPGAPSVPTTARVVDDLATYLRELSSVDFMAALAAMNAETSKRVG
jgi:hypothetical protein